MTWSAEVETGLTGNPILAVGSAGMGFFVKGFGEPVPGGDEEDEEEEFVEDEGEVGEFGDALMEADETDAEEGGGAAVAEADEDEEFEGEGDAEEELAPVGVLKGEVGQPGEAAGGFVEGVEVLHLVVFEDVQGEVFGVEEPEAFGDDQLGDGGDDVGGGEGLAGPVEFEFAAGVTEFERAAADFLDEGVEGGEPDGEEGEVEALGGVADAALGVGQGGGGQAHEDGDGEGEGAGDADDV